MRYDYAENIRLLAKQNEKLKGLGNAKQRLPISGSTKPAVSLQKDDSGAEMVAPLTLEILTYDDAQDVEVTTPTGTATIKTSATAQIIDANGKVWAVDTIIYPAVI